jgi:peptidoglycan/LPS O-acetylase OafA/YrhL
MLAFVPALFSMAALDLPEPQSPASFVLLAASSVLVASFSWFCFERPINNLKRFVSYDSYASKPGQVVELADTAVLKEQTFMPTFVEQR